MDINKRAIWLDLLVTVFFTTFRNVFGSIGHGPGFLPAPLVVGWAKYVPQNVPPHAWTASYHNTGLRVLPAPPYYAPSYPQPIVPVTQPVYPIAPAVTPIAPVAPVLPPPTFNGNPAFLPTPAFNSVPVFGSNVPPTFFRTPAAFPVPKPDENNPSFPVDGNNGFQPTPGDNGSFQPQPANLIAGPPPGPGYQLPINFQSPIVAYPGKFGGPHSQPIRIQRPSYRVTENLEPEPVYGPPPSPYSGKYRSSPSETYGPPPGYHGKSEPIIREYPPSSHIVRVIRPKYRDSEYFR